MFDRTATGIATLLLTLLAWSATPLFLVHFSKHIDAWTSNGWRYLVAAAIWAPLLIWHAARGTLPPKLFARSFWPALFNALGQMAFAASFYRTDATSATFGLRAQIVFVIVGAWVIFPQERPLLRSRQAWLGIFLVLAGVSGAVIFAPAGLSALHWQGVTAAVISGLLFAAYGLSVRKFMADFAAMVSFAAISQLTAALIAAVMVAFGDRSGMVVFRLPPPELWLLVASSVAGIAAGHVFYYMAIARLGVAATSTVLQLQPFVVGLGGWIFFARPLGAAQLVAGFAGFAGAVLVFRAAAVFGRT